ncbi:MAG: polysaccharide pyruvyl transferase family protein [Firmicutes bacterium]|nr:polysaccharide pyruvyl transferase family protein [Bacillota bacterium]
MNILMDGYFDKNFGDDVMQTMLVKALPEHDFFVCCNRRELLSHLENIKNVHITPSIPAVDARVYIVGTGFIINGKRGVLEAVISGIMQKRVKYPKSAVIDCSVEPYKSRAEELVAKNRISEYGLISCRDDASHAYFRDNFKDKKISMFPDALFALDNLYPKTDSGALGIVPARRMYSADNYEYYKKLAWTADYFIEKTGRGVMLFAFDTENENDTAAAYAIYRMVKNKDKIKIVPHNDDGTNVIKNYAECEKIITSRFHGAVLALRYGIAAAAVADNQKTRGLAEKYGFDVFEKTNLDARDLKKFIDKTDNDIKPVYDKSALGHFEVLREFLKA